MKKIVIFGLGRSSIAAINLLSKLDYQIQISDDQAKAIQNIDDSNNIIKCYNINDIKWNNVEFLILSPGIPLYFPKPHQIVKLANRYQIKIISDIEYFYNLFPKQNYIGVTASNGKSTTISLMSEIFANSDKKFDFGGNIGRAIFDMKILPDNNFYLLELSSYQLDMMFESKLKMAILLNITPDHLERHNNFANYVLAKKRIFQNQDQDDFAIIGIDNEQSNRIYQELKSDNNFKAKLIAFSTQKILDNGFSIKDQIIYQNRQMIADLRGRILIRGDHNLENVLASFIACYFSNIDIDIITKSITKFSGIKHRMQFVNKLNNVNFINDSKATNLESTIMAIKSFDNIYLILGGQIKDDNFNLLKNYKNDIKKCYLIGSATEKLYDILSNDFNCNKSFDLKTAIDRSYFDSKNSPTEVNILLSPAAASFDQWDNFEKRGDFFIAHVKVLNDKDL